MLLGSYTPGVDNINWTSADTCRFCGSTIGLRTKHTVPLWFLDEVRADLDRITSFTLCDITSLMDGHFTFPNVIERLHDNRTDFQVCEDCSSGWVRELDMEAKQPFTTLVSKSFTDVGDILKATDYIEHWSNVIVRGAVKTILFCDFVLDGPVIPDRHFKLFGRGTIPEGISVDLGFCSEPTGFRMLSGPAEGEQDDLSRCTYRVAFQSGHLVLMVRHVDGPQYDLHPGTIKLYPDFEVGEELEVFDNSLNIIAWDLLAAVYFNEKAKGRFYGIFE